MGERTRSAATGGPSDQVTVELRFAGLRQFQRAFASNLAADGLFVPCDVPLPSSTVVRLRIVLAGDVLLLRGTGVVFWTRTGADESAPPGMAIRWVTMAAEFEETLRELLEASRRGGAEVPRLDRVAGASPWPAFGAGDRPWEATDVGYRLRVLPPGEAPEPPVTQLRMFGDEVAPLAETAAGQVEREPDAVESSGRSGSDTPPPSDAPQTAAAPGVRTGRSEETAPGVAFEVSFFEDDGAPDTTPRLSEEQGPDVVIGYDDDEDRPTGVVARLRRIAALLPSPIVLLEIAAIVLVLWGTKWVVGRVASMGGGPKPAATAAETPAPTATAMEVPSVAGPAAGGDGDGGEPAPAATSTATPAPSATPTATRRPTATATATPPPLASRAVRDISWTRRGARTRVTIQADGPLPEDSVTVAALSGPPRVLVVVRRIGRPFGRSTIQVGSPELDAIRIGYHGDHDPPSLHVVLDLPDAATGLLEHRILDDRVEVTVGR